MNFTFTGALFAMLAVLLGAFGAHLLKDVLDPSAMQTWETAVRYHFYHSLGMIASGMVYHLLQRSKAHSSGFYFLIGIVLFSGSLYAMALTGIKWLGVITPIGGVCFVIGWAVLAWSSKNT